MIKNFRSAISLMLRPFLCHGHGKQLLQLKGFDEVIIKGENDKIS